METWLKAKTAGLPRWAWVLAVGGAVGLGLYLRSRNNEEEEEVEEEPTPEDSLEAYDETESAGGLAAAGLVGPAQGQITPVEAPYVPQGLVDVLEQQGQTIQELGAREPQIIEGPERVETIETIENTPVVTGGGPSNRKPHHKAPRKPKPKRHPKHPKAHKKPHHKKPHKKAKHHRRKRR